MPNHHQKKTQNLIDVQGSCLIIFVKNAVEGLVKTRIASTAGTTETLSIYRKLLNIISKTCSQSEDYDKIVYYSDEICLNDEWNDSIFQKKLQTGRSLGDKMHNAFTDNIKFYNKIILIGSDCPYITISILNQAFEYLSENDLVIGPAQDGGYYLIGMKDTHPQLFEDISWSTEMVLNQTKEKIASLGLKAAYVDTLSDVDTEDDWHNWILYSGKQKS